MCLCVCVCVRVCVCLCLCVCVFTQVRTLFVSDAATPADCLFYALGRTEPVQCIVQDLCEGGDLYG